MTRKRGNATKKANGGKGGRRGSKYESKRGGKEEDEKRGYRENANIPPPLAQSSKTRRLQRSVPETREWPKGV